MDYTSRWKWTRSQQPSILVLDPPTHPEDENFAGNLWPGQHLPGHGCRGPTDAPGYLSQPSGLPCAGQLHLQVAQFSVGFTASTR